MSENKQAMQTSNENISAALDEISLKIRTLSKRESSASVPEYHKNGDAISVRFHSCEEHESEQKAVESE